MVTEVALLQGKTWRQMCLLRHLSIDEIAQLEREAIIYKYDRQECIFEQKKIIRGIYIVLSGIVKQLKRNQEGKDYIFRMATSYEILGFRSVLSDELACNTSIAVSPATVCYIPKDSLIRLIRTNGSFALELLQVACRELEESHSLMTDNAQKQVKARLAEILVMFGNKFGMDAKKTLNIVLSREDYANIIGTTRENVIRLLGEFKTTGLIDSENKQIRLIDMDGLRKMAGM